MEKKKELKETRLLMGMPITVQIVDETVLKKDIDDVFDYFDYIDHKFSTYKDDSEIMKINRGELKEEDYSEDMMVVLKLCEETKKLTDGYFDIKKPNGLLDPSGLVKGWAIKNAAGILKTKGFINYFVDAGGDIEIAGHNAEGKPWQVGIRNPFNRYENVKILKLTDIGIATSGTAIRGQHIYNPHNQSQQLVEIVSLTVIGPNVYEADRFATAAFAMQQKGVGFINTLPGFACYSIDCDGMATFTENITNYLVTN
jgi:FAD:protein FMN transferase